MLSSHIASQIYTNFLFTPTKEQKKLIDSLGEFITSGLHGDIFIVNGYAGTGKTTVMSALIKTFKEYNIDVTVMAPTGRAAKVIAQYSMTKALTVHKKIYRQKSSTIESFDLNFNKSKDSFFIVDEASMLNDSSFEASMFGSGNLLQDMIDFIRAGSNCRLILVGDKAQLPPVGHSLSPALDVTTMEHYGNVTYCELTEVVRQQKDSGILINATIIRRLIERGRSGIPRLKLDYPDIRYITGADVLEELEGCYSRVGLTDTTVITRSNKQANRFNQAIRMRVLDHEEELSSGDLIMVVKNNYHYLPEGGRTDFIANGDIAEIVRLRHYHERYGFRFLEAELSLPDYDDAQMSCIIMLDTLESETPSLSAQQGDALFHAVEEDYMDTTRKGERYKKMKDDPYLNALQIKFAYAVTCHKSQGGQWSNVFVDRMLWGEEVMTTDLQRWLYTAVTRARERLYLVSFDDRFFTKPPQDNW